MGLGLGTEIMKRNNKLSKYLFSTYLAFSYLPRRLGSRLRKAEAIYLADKVQQIVLQGRSDGTTELGKLLSGQNYQWNEEIGKLQVLCSKIRMAFNREQDQQMRGEILRSLLGK